jgi:hypothetical protein
VHGCSEAAGSDCTHKSKEGKIRKGNITHQHISVHEKERRQLHAGKSKATHIRLNKSLSAVTSMMKKCKPTVPKNEI